MKTIRITIINSMYVFPYGRILGKWSVSFFSVADISRWEWVWKKLIIFFASFTEIGHVSCVYFIFNVHTIILSIDWSMC